MIPDTAERPFFKVLANTHWEGTPREFKQSFFDVIVDPSGLMIEEGDDDLTAILDALLEGIGEVIGSIALDFDTHRLLEGDSEGLGALLEHTHEFLGLVEAVVHKDPVFETSSMLNFLLDISQIVTILKGHFFSVDFNGEIFQGVTLNVHRLF
jgi:hypothetical protein